MTPIVRTCLRRRGAVAACSLVILLLLAALPAAGHGEKAHVLRFDHGRWLAGETFVERTIFAVDGVLRARYEGAVEGVIDLEGGYVIPPFADAHRHAFADGMDVEAQRVEMLRAGIFYLKNPNNIAALTAPLREHVNRPTSVDVIYSNGSLTAAGGHPIPIYEGGHGARAGHRAPADAGNAPRLADQAYFVVDDAAGLEAKWPLVRAGAPDFLKVNLVVSEQWAARRDDPRFYGRRGLDPALLPAIVARAHGDGLRVSAHVETAADVRAALAAGVDEINHLPLERLAPGDAERLAAAGVVVVTTVLSHRQSDHVPDLDDVHRHNLRLLRRAGVALAVGTDNNEVTAVDEAERLRALGGFDHPALLQLMTRASAEAIFPGRRIGRLADGWEASFLVLGGDPHADFAAVRDIRLRVKQGVVLDLPAAVPALPSIAEALLERLHAGDVEGAIARYHALREQEGAAWDFAEPRLNELGYRLLGHAQPAAAAVILALNAEVYPTSPNAWDSLAEAAVAAGERQRAIDAYRRVLALLPAADGYAPDFRDRLEANARAQLAALGAPAADP